MKTTVHDPILLYSASTRLAYMIAQNYYGKEHYVWCTPHFDANSMPSLEYTVPPSSSPLEIYLGLLQEVDAGDRHSAKIEANKAGILRGVQKKLKSGVITKKHATEIASIIKAAETKDFAPLIFVIPYILIKDKIKPVPVNQRAHPLSQEYIIDRLPRSCFDVISIRNI
jgi:hypothetical protein